MFKGTVSDQRKGGKLPSPSSAGRQLPRHLGIAIVSGLEIKDAIYYV